MEPFLVGFVVGLSFVVVVLFLWLEDISNREN